MECTVACDAKCVKRVEATDAANGAAECCAPNAEIGTKGATGKLADALAFVGNSFLAPMSQTLDAGLDRVFWAAFPDFGSEQVARALDGLFAWAVEGEDVPRAERVRAVSVEYARLFIGPPEPAVAPWESFYVQEGVTNGFGEPTFRMQERLRQAGLEVSNANNQYADHIGIELLYCSALAQRAAAGELSHDEEEGAAGAREATLLRSFVEVELLAWLERFAAALHGQAATYYGLLADLAVGLASVARAVPQEPGPAA